jgi:predicted dehydrogenase
MQPHSSAIDRRRFLKTASVTGLGLVVASERAPLLFAAAGSPNEKVVVAVMGLNGRGTVLARAFARTPHAEVASVCDVDAQVLAKAGAAVAEVQTRAPAQLGDFRRALDDKAVDALVIAAPDHWHAPAAILAMQAGKHVYVEKPCGHNPHEGELLVRARRRYGRVVQMGTQQRSSPHSIEVVQAIKEGAIGRPYLGRGWYANTRATIGRGAVAPVPPGLDYELWQGPAPRTPYRDNVIHYNWHWFRRWGTGEICNNGTHEIDVCRWALGVDYPVAVTSSGGRYHFADDWEFPDTQEAVFEFADGRTIVWQGQSCNGLSTNDRSRGVAILGTMGSVVLDRDGYTIYDLKNQVVRQFVAPQQAESQKVDPLNVTADDAATGLHIANFVEAVRTGAALHAPIEEGVKSVLLCHLGNIAQRTRRKLRTDPAAGQITGDPDAMKLWRREYAPGWEPKV